MRAEKRLSLNPGNFYINTIDELDKKIANLSGSLDEFSENRIEGGLVIDESHHEYSYFENIAIEKADQDEDNAAIFGFGKLQHDFIEEKNENKFLKANDNKEMDQFAGVFSCKVSLSPGAELQSKVASTRSFKKKIQEKIGMSESHQNLAKRPMLVELHSFPGFDKDEITPLPSPLQAIDVLKIVTEAQLDLERKPSFKREFVRFFHSRLSQAILQDVFWWFFCHKYQPVLKSQQNLFNRIAHNYTKQLNRCMGWRYQDTIFKRYPDLLSQAVYATFCQAFPTSYRQFDDKFKDELIFLVHLWMVGTKPAPGTFSKWNSKRLEPIDMRRGEKLHAEATSSTTNQVFELQLNEESLGLLKNGSTHGLGPSSHGQSHAHSTKTSKAAGAASKKTNLVLPVINNTSTSKDTSSSPRSKHQQNGSSVGHTELKSGHKQAVDYDKGSKLVSNGTHEKSTVKHMPTMRHVKESCKAGKGPEFSKNVFDIYGRSPLVEQFLIANRLATEAGTTMLVRRTEISKLESATAPTYQEVIKESLNLSRVLEKNYRSTLEENATERAKFLKKQKALQKDLSRKTAQLMSNPKEVKRLSELLRLELLRDEKDDDSPWSSQATLSSKGGGLENNESLT